jgi:WD40 repeat protein/transcriptional regulator with XRE-family HTH domain
MVVNASYSQEPLPNGSNSRLRTDGIFDGRDFAQALTGLRELAGLSIRDVARATGIPAATLGGYFSGRHLPSRPMEALVPILRVCGVAERDALPWIEALARARRNPGPRGNGAVRPYPGLRSFDVPDAEWFFGREQVTQRLLDRVQAAFDAASDLPIVVVTGSSGSGKSSLVRAGLLPILDMPTLTMSPGLNPMAELATQLASLQGCAVPEIEADIPRRSAMGGALDLGLDCSQLLLVVDQFEEVFAPTITDDARSSFLALLDGLSRPGGRTRVVAVLVLRSDFYRQASEEPILHRALQEGQILLGAMSAPELRSAIVEPARRAGVTVDDDLVELVLRDMATFGGRRATHDPGALPLMSHALMESWKHSHRGRLTRAEYLSTGGIEHAAQQTAENMYLALSESGQALTRRIFLRLAHVEEAVPLTRRRARRSELLELADEPGRVESILDQFVNARLLTSDAEELSLSHESLLQAWPRLAGWIEADLDSLRRHRQLTSAAQQWNAEGRDEDALWRGMRLEDTQRWLDADSERSRDLNRTEREFLGASAQLEGRRQAEVRRRLRHTRHLMIAISMFAALACLLATIAGVAQNRSSRAERNAAQQRDLAQSRQLAIEATQLEATDPALASQLALAGYRVSPTLESRSAVLDSLAVATPIRLLGQPGPTPIAVSEDGLHIAMGNAVTGAVQLFRRSPGAAVPERTGIVPGGGRDSQVFALVYLPHTSVLATGGQDSLVRLWDVAQPAAPKLLGPPLRGIVDAVESIAFSPDGHFMAVGGGGHAVLLWDVADPTHPKRLKPITGLPGVVQCVRFSPDGTILAAGGAAGVLRRWRLGPQAVTALPPLPSQPPATTRVNSIAFSPDGSLFAAGSTDSVVRVWQAPADRAPAPMPHLLTGFSNWVNTVAFSPNGQTLAAGGSDNKVMVWAVRTWQELWTLPHPGPVTGVGYLPDSSQVLSASADGTGRLWPMPGTILPGAQGNVFALNFSNAGVLAVGAAHEDRAVRLWRVAGSTRPTEVGRAESPAKTWLTGAAAISGDSRLVAAGSKDGTILLWDSTDLRNPRLLPTLTGLHQVIEWLTFSPDSRILAAGSDDSVIRLWDLGDSRRPHVLSTLREPTGFVFSMAFSPDGSKLAAASADHLVRLWDLAAPAAPRLLATLDAFKSYVYSVAISSDGKLLAAGSADHSIRLWDITRPERPDSLGAALTGPNNTVFSLSFSPRSPYLAAGSADGTVRVWDIRRPDEPTPLAVLRATDAAVFAVSFSSDGSTLAASGTGRQIHLWPTAIDAAVEGLCHNAGDSITRTEWAQYAHDLPYRPPCG